MATEWFCQIMNDTVGPLSSRQLLDHIRSGNVKEDTLVRKDDSQWVHAREVGGLFDAAGHKEAARVCPYCGHEVDRPPTTCLGCNRKLVLSFNSRLTTLDQHAHQQAAVDKDPAASVADLSDRHDRSDIIRYTTLILLWGVLLFVSPYLIYLAMEGHLIFTGELTFIPFLGVSAFIGLLYYLISRMAR